jgi:hypothetical protein
LEFEALAPFSYKYDIAETKGVTNITTLFYREYIYIYMVMMKLGKEKTRPLTDKDRAMVRA